LRVPLLFAGLLALPFCGYAEAPLRAERIGEQNFESTHIGGPDAIGGIGDWYLANDVVEVVVDAPSRRHAKLNHGGTIVDAGRLDRENEDQFARLIPIANFSQRVFVGYDAIRAEVDEERGSAQLVVTSPGMQALPRGSAWSRFFDPMVPDADALSAVEVETRYEVRRAEPFVRITTTFENTGEADAPLFSFGEFWMRGLRAKRAFTGHTLAPEEGKGFVHRAYDHHQPESALPALAALTHVVAPGVSHFPPISYAIVSPERASRALPFLGLTAEHINVMLGLVGDEPFRGRGVMALLGGILTGELAPGERWTYERRLVIGPEADVASTTDLVLPMLGVTAGSSAIVGRVAPAGLAVGILVERDDGVPITHVRAKTEGADAGRFRAVVPAGRYQLTLRAPMREPRQLEVEVPAGGEGRIPDQSFEAPGALRFEPAFADFGPGRVVVRGIGDTPDPIFHDELFDYRLEGLRPPGARETDTLFFAGLASDPRRVELAPGRYRLTAVRGLAYDAAQVDIEVPASGAEVRVPPFALEHAVALEGLVSADFHVHAQASDDTATPNEDRLRAFAAEAVDVLVASDHDNIPDYGPALEKLGLEGRLRVITGVEITSSAPSHAAPWSIGHHNAWPIDRRPRAHRNGTPPSQDIGVADLYSGLRANHAVEVIQLNHARGRVPQEGGLFFTHLGTVGEGFDPTRAIDAEPNQALLFAAADGTRAVDFDAMEILNGDARDAGTALRRDWYALLAQGYARTGTANSDTHGPGQIAGFPRNFVWRAEGESFSELVRAGRLFGTSGPLVVRFEVDGALPGTLVRAEGGRVRIDYAVASAPWVPVDERRLLVNGTSVVEDLPEAEGTLFLSLDRDAFVTLEAGAPLDVSRDAWVESHPGLYTEVLAPGHVPVAFTNPVYIDVDGNGVFDPPGLGASASAITISRE
jgi:hypothetical protein